MKNKIKKQQVKKLVSKMAISIILCLAIAIVPTLSIINKSLINEKFGKNLNTFQGVLEIWHIDTFEGGTNGKYQFLKGRALDFENSNKGTYFMVKNMTEKQCLLALENGQLPAMFSFAVGVGNKILDYLAQLNISNLNIRDDFLNAGKHGGQMLAYPWCRGVYSLITTTQRLQSVNKESNNLVSIATSCGYTKQLKNNKTKITYSLAFGSAGYVSPQLAFATEHKNLVQTQTSIDINNTTKTPYNAYCDFIEGKANILLGSQRDVARIENRISVGKIDNVVYQHLTAYTDLVQFFGITKNQTEQVYNTCAKFIEFICSNKVQQKLSNIGMFSINNNLQIYSAGEWQTIENQTQKTCLVQNAFTTNQALTANKQACIDCQQV